MLNFSSSRGETALTGELQTKQHFMMLDNVHVWKAEFKVCVPSPCWSIDVEVEREE